MTASLALLLAATTVAAATPVEAPARVPARAACAAGSDGVTVVVDFGNLPGGVQIRCVTEPVSSGFDALVKAGFTYAGTQRFPGLLCRIDGKPADDPCVNAPPPDRYWAYWTASQPGGAWSYSDLGAGNRTPPPGSVEGWAFSDGCTRSPQGPPCPTATTTTTRPCATTTTTAAGGSGGGTTRSGGTGSPTTAVPGQGPDSETTTTESRSGSSTTTAVPRGGTAPEPGEEGDDDGGTDQQAAALTDDDDDGGGSAAGVLVGLGVVAGLGALAVVTARRRGAEREPV